MQNIHDTHYKERLSNPLFVQQLCEGFLPKAIHEGLDFSTLENRSGYYITPAMKELYQEVVWEVGFRHGQEAVPIYLCLLLEFQSEPNWVMPHRMLNYVASFYQSLIKTKKLSLRTDKLPPVLPVVLYNGKQRWKVATRMQHIIAPVPKVLRRFQPHLSYFLIDEQRLTKEVFEQAPEPLGNMLSLNQTQNAEDYIALWEALRHKTRNHPEFQLLNNTINHWLSYTLHLRNPKIKLSDMQTIDKETIMWTFESEIERISKERAEAAAREGYLTGQQDKNRMIAKRMLNEGMSHERIAKLLDIPEAAVAKYAAG